MVSSRTSEWERDALIAALEEENIPVGPINDVAEALADPQIVARQMVLDMLRGDGKPIPGLRTPIVFSDAELELGKPSPELGEGQ
jgi:crotonobetainyl-CoA:carnitine CoA-transferase CaiB-like acyl-CoA transferase